MTYYYHYHAAKHQNGHQADSQADGSQAQLVYAGAVHIFGLALKAAVMVRAGAGGLAFCSSGAGSAVQAGMRGTAACWLVAVAACVPWRTGAGVVVDAVYAGGAVCAGVPGTLVDVDLAAQTCEA